MSTLDEKQKDPTVSGRVSSSELQRLLIGLLFVCDLDDFDVRGASLRINYFDLQVARFRQVFFGQRDGDLSTIDDFCLSVFAVHLNNRTGLEVRSCDLDL